MDAGAESAAATIASGIALDIATAAIALGSQTIVAGTAGCFVGAILAGVTTSPRHLVNYFKNR